MINPVNTFVLSLTQNNFHDNFHDLVFNTLTLTAYSLPVDLLMHFLQIEYEPTAIS